MGNVNVNPESVLNGPTFLNGSKSNTPSLNPSTSRKQKGTSGGKILDGKYSSITTNIFTMLEFIFI